jgi:hypothetical protein
MTTLANPVFGSDEHPAGQIVVPVRRTLGARNWALAGRSSDDMRALNTIVGLVGAAGLAVNSVTDGMAA